jgi:uncharacterized membrane protein
MERALPLASPVLGVFARYRSPKRDNSRIYYKCRRCSAIDSGLLKFYQYRWMQNGYMLLTILLDMRVFIHSCQGALIQDKFLKTLRTHAGQ